MRDPEVACLLLQAEVATVIPVRFLKESSLTSLDLSAESVVTQIGSSFLMGCTSLTSIDISGLIHVTKIGNGFLEGCSSLRTLDLTPWSNVTYVGISFLQGCTLLENIRSIYVTDYHKKVVRRQREALRKLRLRLEERSKRSRDEPLEESRKRLRHAE